MTVAKLLVFASCWTAIVTQATEDLMPEIDDECAAEGCAISALQARAMSVSKDSEVPLGGPFDGGIDGGLDDLMPDPDEEGVATDDEDDEEETGGPGLCGGEAYDSSKEGCCGGVLYDLTAQSCCGTEIYDIKGEGCCNSTEVFDTTKQGCCNKEQVFNLGEEYLTFGLKCIAPAKPPWDTKFDCTEDWPPKTYAPTWKRYCAARRNGYHMAWAMTMNCEVGWLSVLQRTREDSKMKAKSQCQARSNAYNKDQCYIFDFDGKACHRQRCGEKLYDATMMGCCSGELYDLRTQDCCSGHIFETKTTGCCNGKVYHKEPRRCCGNKHLFNSKTHGCCLEKGPQVFRFGTQNCCAAPSGTCKIPTGVESCCKREGRTQVGDQ